MIQTSPFQSKPASTFAVPHFPSLRKESLRDTGIAVAISIIFFSGRGRASKLAVGTGHFPSPFSCTRAPLAVFSLSDIAIPSQVVGAAVTILAALRQRRVHALLTLRKKEAARTASFMLVGRELDFPPHGPAQIRQIQPIPLFFFRLNILLLLQLFLDS